jgi:hypothetical protein
MFSYYKKEFINSVYVLAMKRLNDLDYLKLNKLGKLLYKLKLFLFAIPVFFKNLGLKIFGAFKSFGLGIKNSVCDIAYTFTKGNWAVKLSFFFFGITLSSMVWKTIKSVGTTNKSARVPISIPPTVPTPIEMLPFAPTPVANIMGNIPKTIVSEVIRIALNLALAAERAAMTIDIPSALRADAYSVSRIAVLASRPISISRPIWR